eukprot:scaffold301890_cov33-Tisochrysis_lutea.AAC.2
MGRGTPTRAHAGQGIRGNVAGEGCCSVCEMGGRMVDGLGSQYSQSQSQSRREQRESRLSTMSNGRRRIAVTIITPSHTFILLARVCSFRFRCTVCDEYCNAISFSSSLQLFGSLVFRSWLLADGGQRTARARC